MSESIATSLSSSVKSRLKRGKTQLPPVPGAAVHLMELSQRANVDAAQLTAVIQRDRALAGRVLRVANAGSFRGVNQIVSLHQAVARLGSELITELACAASLQSAFPSPAYAAQTALCTRVSLGAALFAKRVARSSRRNVEAAFLIGLMHNLGEATVLYLLGKRRGLTPDLLQACIDQTEVDAGLAVAKTWKLPLAVRSAVEFYRNPEIAPPEHGEPAAVAALARYLARRVFLPEGCAPTTEAPGLEILGLYPDEVEEILDDAEEVRDTVRAMEGG
ncbi:MAG: HDOD domain-containing protein [Myxococcota bacterium]